MESRPHMAYIELSNVEGLPSMLSFDEVKTRDMKPDSKKKDN